MTTRTLPALLLFILAPWLLAPLPASARAQFLELPNGDEISYAVYPAQGKTRFIWLAPEAGLQEAEREAARELAQQRIETWYPDLFETNFLPIAASSVDRFPPGQVEALINAAAKDKEVYLVTSGRGVKPLLNGLRRWQLAHPGSTAVKGVILVSAKFFVATPDPGQAAELLPITTATNAPIYILQPDKSPWRWKLDQTLPALQQGGSDVFLQTIPGVRDRFYYRPDATPYEQQLAAKLPFYLQRAARLLSYLPAQREAVKTIASQVADTPTSKKERVLSAMPGSPAAKVLRLKNLQGEIVDLRDYRGEVVMVNFWASWCPPCVFEMPSMQRLKQQLAGKPFRILAVNMAEDQPTIEKFLRDEVNVDFTVLLDSDGAALKRWGVFAFPTTYFIDRHGRLRYGLFGGREWDRPDVLETLQQLLVEQP